MSRWIAPILLALVAGVLPSEASARVVKRVELGSSGLLLLEDDFTDEKYAEIHLGGFENGLSELLPVRALYILRYEEERKDPVLLVRDTWDLDSKGGYIRWRIDRGEATRFPTRRWNEDFYHFNALEWLQQALAAGMELHVAYEDEAPKTLSLRGSLRAISMAREWCGLPPLGRTDQK